MIDKLKKALAKSTAEYTDIRHEDINNMGIMFAKDKLHEVSSSFISGAFIRAFKNGGIGYACCTSLKNLDKAVKSACEKAAVMGRHAKLKEGLAPAPVVKDKFVPKPKIDPRTISFDEKKTLVQDYNKLALNHDKVQTTTSSYFESFSTENFVNSEGTEITQDIRLCRVGGRVVTKDGSNVQSMGFSFGYDSDYSRLLNREDVVERQTKIAIDLLKADSPDAGVFSIVCNPDLGSIFIHEAFGHLSESDDIVNNPTLAEAMKIGRRFGQPILNVVDQGNFPGAPGSYPYDHEGVATGKTYLIKEGVLVGRLFSRGSSYHLGGKPTGNYRARDYRVNPICRMSNIFIEAGKTPFKEMISSVKKGLYLCSGKGGQTMGDLFTFGASYGYEINNGKLGKMIGDVNISGNVFKTLANISAVGNDFKMSEWGGCGKARLGIFNLQMLDKSGTGSPHVLIKDVVIGGK
jgi:TldD protein